MQNIFVRLVVFMAIISFIVSCKKEKDEIPPQIIISYPVENTIFDVFDTIHITATVKDETALKNIKVNLVNDNFVNVLNTISITPESNSVVINIDYPIDNKYLENGIYHVMVRANDGINSKNSYKKIFISEIPKRLLYICALTKVNSNTIDVIKIDSTFTDSLMFSVNSDYCASAISSKYGYIAVSGKYFGDVNVFDMETHLWQWSISSIVDPPFPYFEHVFYKNDKLYVSFYNGDIKGYDYTGQVKYSAVAPTGMYPVKAYIDNNYLFADMQESGSSDRNLVLFYLYSGAVKQQLQITYTIVDFYSKDDDNVFIFGNNGNNGVMKIYNIQDNGTWQPQTLSGGKIYAVAQVDASNYLIACENEVLWYKYDNNSLTTFVPNISARKIRYDELSSQVFVAEENKISVYRFPLGGFQNSVTLTDSIVDIHMVYNK